MKERLRTVSKKIVESDKYLSERMVCLGSLCMEASDLISQESTINTEKLNELAKKCIEIGVVSDSIVYELFLSNQVKIEELEKTVKEAVKKL